MDLGPSMKSSDTDDVFGLMENLSLLFSLKSLDSVVSR